MSMRIGSVMASSFLRWRAPARARRSGQRIDALQASHDAPPGARILGRNSAGVYAGLLIDWLTMVKPVIATSSQMVRCPTMPTAPPIMQRPPIVVLPEMPTHAAIAVCAPMRTLWPIWIWLSSLTPSRSRCPRSRRDRSWCWRRSPRPHRCAPRRPAAPSATRRPAGAKPNPSAPMTAPGCMSVRAPIRTDDTPSHAQRTHILRNGDLFLDHAMRPYDCPLADQARAPMTAKATHVRGSDAPLHPAATTAEGCTPAEDSGVGYSNAAIRA